MSEMLYNLYLGLGFAFFILVGISLIALSKIYEDISGLKAMELAARPFIAIGVIGYVYVLFSVEQMPGSMPSLMSGVVIKEWRVK